MSIFSWVVPIATFIQNLLTSVKKEYLNLESSVKSLLDAAIKFGNIIKGYIANPGTAGVLAGTLITIAEGVIGTGLTQTILAVLGEVVVDLGIAETAISDPTEALQAILTHLASFKGKAFADKLFNTVENIALRITGLTDNNEIKAIIAIAYKIFFSSTAATTTVDVPATNEKIDVAVNTPDKSTPTPAIDTAAGPADLNVSSTPITKNIDAGDNSTTPIPGGVAQQPDMNISQQPS